MARSRRDCEEELAETKRQLDAVKNENLDLQWALTGFAALVGRVSTLDACRRESVNLGRSVATSECCFAMRSDDTGQFLSLDCHSDGPLTDPATVPVETANYIGQAFSVGPALLNTVEEQDRRVFPSLGIDRTVRNALAVPMKLRDRHVGIMSVLNRLPLGTGYDTQDASRLQVFANTAALVMENARLTEELRWHAENDAMTGLKRRDRLPELMGQLLRDSQVPGGWVHMCIADLDRFKDVNDEAGYQRGDEVIKAVAEQLKNLPFGNALSCHWGGDEFVVILISRDPAEGEQLVSLLRERVQLVLTSDDLKGFKLGVSIGLASAEREAADYSGLAKLADEKLHEEKEEKRRRGDRPGRCCR